MAALSTDSIFPTIGMLVGFVKATYLFDDECSKKMSLPSSFLSSGANPTKAPMYTPASGSGSLPKTEPVE